MHRGRRLQGGAPAGGPRRNEQFTLIIVTHSMQQARRVSSQTAFFHLGRLVEMGETKELFNAPALQQTKDYITGRYG